MTLRLLAIPVVLVSSLSAGAARAGDENATLTAEILALDGKVFDAYNRCDLKTFGNFFSPSVEFYHETGGATFDRKTVVASTKKYICHKVRREPIAASLKVYPIKNFGAVEEGEHRFCQIESGTCEGIAKFLIIWRKRAGGWQITRVVSYGHRT
ncbi:MAG: nuclear transport factor 2 family protein, partial [Micropepsaceae bacterium]